MYLHHWGSERWDHIGTWVGEPWFVTALAVALPLFILCILWSVFWKGLALWHSARREQYWWFVILLVVNTLGILEIIYLFFVAKMQFKDLFSLKEHHTHHTRSG